MNEIFKFTEFHNVLFGILVCLSGFAVFFQANRLYSRTNNMKMAIIAIGFLVGGIFELIHTGFAYISIFLPYQKIYSAISFIYLSLSNISFASSIFLALIYSSYFGEKKFNFKKVCIFAFVFVFAVISLIQGLNALNSDLFFRFLDRVVINNPAVEILDNALYILSVFLYRDIGKLNKQKILTPFLFGLLFLGIGQLYVLNPAYLTSAYRFYIHIAKITGLLLIMFGLKDFLKKEEIATFRYKLITYPALLLMGFYLVFLTVREIIAKTVFSAQTQYVFVFFFIAAIVIEYFLSSKFTSQITNAIKHIESFAFDEEPTAIPITTNDEIGLLIKKLNESTRLIWENNHELLIKQKQILESNSREKLLRKISETIRNSLDIDIVKNNIVTEVGKSFNADRCFIRLYGANNFSFPIDAEYLSSPDIKSAKNREYSEEFNKYVKEYFGKKQSLIMYDHQNIINDLSVPQDFKEFINDLDIKSNYSVPIYNNNELIGALSIQYTKQTVQIDDNVIKLLNMISAQAATALYQAKLFDTVKQMVEHERLLKEIIAVTKSNLDINEILTIICEKCLLAFGGQRISIVDFKDLSKEEMVFFEYKKENVNGPKEANSIYFEKFSKYWGTQLITKGQSVIVNNLSNFDMPEEVKSVYDSINIKSIISLPLKIGDKNWGGLFLYSYYSPRYWKDSEISTLQTIKEHISISIWEKKLYNKEQLLTNISHELKTPVAIINSYTESLINRDKNKSEMSEKFLGIIKNNVDRITNIIDDILYLSSFEHNSEIKKQEFSSEELGGLITSSVDLCKENANFKNIKIDINYSKPVYAKINSLLIQQALINLINNAIKYSNDNTNIFISLKENETEALISIQDEGCGIKEEEFENIFKRFYRIDKSRCRQTGGSGLGLSIVEKIIDFHGGYIDLKSDVGKGTVFTIHLLK